MNVTTEKVAEGQVALTIEIEPESVEKAMNQAYHRLVVKTMVPGFRKGKAPRAMLERFLGQGALMEEALQRLVPQVFTEALKEQDIKPFAEPKYEVVQLEPVIVKATVDLPPSVELGSYQDARATLESSEITDDDVNSAIDRVRDSMATWEDSEGPIELGDRVTVDIRGTKDGEEFFEREGFPYVVSAENSNPVPGFAQHLVGMPKRDEKEFDISFPADHDDQALAGHSYHFRAKVSEIKAKRLPPLDDEFAKSAGEDIETLEQLLQRVRENLVEAKDRRTKEELVDKIVREVVDISKFEIPPSIVDQQVHDILADEEERLKGQHFSLEQYLKMIGKTPEQHHEELEPVARERVKRGLALSKVAEAENLKVEPSEIDAAIEETAREAGAAAEAFRRFYAMPEGRASLERSILSRKTLHRLVEIATEGAVDYPEMAAAPSPAEGEVAETPQEAGPGEPEAPEAGEVAQEK